MNSPIEVKVPFENVNDPTAKLVAWKVPSGTLVKEGDEVAELENSKATFPVTAPASGVVWHRHAEGEEVPVGETLFVIGGDGMPPKSASQSQRTVTAGASAAASNPSVDPAEPMFSRRARELLTELGLDPSLFHGMPQVRESDVLKCAEELGKSRKTETRPTPSPSPPPTGERAGERGPLLPSSQPKSEYIPHSALRTPNSTEEGDLVPLDRAKQVENRGLAAMDRSAIKSTIFYLCPAAGLQQACARQSPPTQRLAIALFETARLLRKYRSLNACFTDAGMFVYRNVNLGFAVDLGRGLKVLVIRDADNLAFAELASKFEELLVKYSTGTLGVLDVTGSTFTLTDLGAEGAFAFVPVINARQAAIVGLGAETRDHAGLPNGFMLSCTFDHRLVAGKLVAEFLSELSARLAAHKQSLAKSGSDTSLCCSRCLQTVEQLRKLRAFLLPSVEPPGYICTNCLTGF
jgi:pyruvate/2-oxoglutarate dehydrogenase complex dihydrolipoamide acyltransferase (E2) component